MIYGDIKNTDEIENICPSSIVKGINYLKNTDFSNIKAGKYEIEGEDLFCLVMDTNTKEKSLNKPEVHRNFIDIQFLLEGEEVIGFIRDNGNNKVLEDELEERDVLFYEDVEDEIDLIMKPGNFAIFFPNDIHRPTCKYKKEEVIRKVVVKINKKLL
ncbi:MAG: YhcH/YjgK/YiaL family protein [Clostridiaceae bacterium]